MAEHLKLPQGTLHRAVDPSAWLEAVSISELNERRRALGVAIDALREKVRLRESRLF